MIDEKVYFAPGFSSIDEVREAHGPIYDATTLSKITKCPRHHEVRVEEGLEKGGQASAKMVAGIVMHLALDWYYAIPEEERTLATETAAIDLVVDEWASWDLDRTLMDSKALHLDEDHLSEVLANYFETWNRQRIEVYKPLSGITLNDLDLSDVLAAKFKTNGGGEIILGESSLVMEFEILTEDREVDTLVLAGKPDLPVAKQDGRLYIMDHKTTSGYLSSWWAQTHEVSNKLRGYQAMIEKLLGVETAGAVINAIYVGKHATNPDSTATKTARYQFDFSPAHVVEALRNQYEWTQTIAHYRERGYFPQGCGYGGCAHPDLCKRDPDTRAEVKRTDYEKSDRTFWDL